MVSKARVWRQSLSRGFGHWAGKRSRQYACPVWADKDAYTYAFLKAAGIIKT
jgi:hypothetical protein